MTSTTSQSDTAPVPDDGASLADRLARLEDYEAIRSLCLSYGKYLDEKQWDSFVELFAEKGGQSSPIGTVSGREAIRALFDSTLKDLPQAFHVYTEPMIDLAGDRAAVRFGWYYYRRGADGQPELLQLGSYNDTVVRDFGTWRFELRKLTRDAGSPPYTR